MKTAQQWLSELPDPYNSLALQNCQIPNEKFESLQHALWDSFTWEQTPQKFKFWNTVFHWSYEPGKLPPIPQTASKTNKLNCKGVRFRKGGFIAEVNFEGKTKHLGTFKTKEEAKTAFNEFTSKIHKEFFCP